jgi:hypothetical protein
MPEPATPNASGVYPVQSTEVLARHGERSHATVELCQCSDGLYRYGLSIAYSYGGFGSPIHDRAEGFATARAALDAGTAALLDRFPSAFAGEPESVHAELADMRAQVEARFRQPSLL